MTKQLVKLISILLMLSMTSFTPLFAEGDDKPLDGKKLVMVIKSADSSEAGMGLSLAHSAVKKGAQVTIVLGANGLCILLKMERNEFLPPKIKFRVTCSKKFLPMVALFIFVPCVQNGKI